MKLIFLTPAMLLSKPFSPFTLPVVPPVSFWILEMVSLTPFQSMKVMHFPMPSLVWTWLVAI